MAEEDPIPILQIRGLSILRDADPARLYGVSTKRLNEQVKRNADRFPEDFMFQLSSEEWNALKSQIATSSLRAEGLKGNRSQIATTSHGGMRKLPWAFTEHGALQVSNVLKTDRAVAMSVFIIRAFIKQREDLATNASILKRLAEIDKTLLVRDTALRDLYQKLRSLLLPLPEKPKRRIGFHRENG